MRASSAGPELLFVRRPRSMRAFAGFHAFPGGSVDAEDCSDQAAQSSVLSPMQAKAILGRDAGAQPAIGFFVCALRELFEEVGILFAEDETGPAELASRDLEEMRRSVLSGERSFSQVIASRGLRLATHRLRYVSRWVAPPGLPVRFDARFFAAAAIGEPHPNPDEVEAVDWKTADQILALSEAGAVMLAPPTAATLMALARFGSADEMVAGIIPAPTAQGGAGSERSPNLERCSPLVGRIVAPNPSIMTGPGTNTYIVGKQRAIVIDPGSNEPSHLDAIVSAAAIRTIVVTHGHADHYAGALELAQRTGAELLVSREFGGTFEAFQRRLVQGSMLEADGADLQVVETPGHSRDHICLWLQSEGALFSGDLVLGEGTTVISPPDGDLAVYLESLQKVLALQPARLYPAHFAPRDDAAGWIAWYIEHRLEREAQILACLEKAELTIPQIVEEVYAEYPRAVYPVAERSVLAHLIKLEAEGRVASDEGKYRLPPKT